MFIFSKFLSFIFSLGKFGPTKSEVCQIKWNLVQGYIVYAYFDLNVYFFKILFFSYFFWQIWSQNVKFFKLTEIWYIGRLLYAYFYFIVYFSNFLSFIFVQANLVPKPEVLQIDWNVIFWCLFSQNFNHSYFWANLVPQTEVLHIDWSLVQQWITIYMLNMILMLIVISKHFVIHIVLGKFGPKAVLPINWNLAFVYIINIICWQ